MARIQLAASAALLNALASHGQPPVEEHLEGAILSLSATEGFCEAVVESEHGPECGGRFRYDCGVGSAMHGSLRLAVQRRAPVSVNATLEGEGDLRGFVFWRPPDFETPRKYCLARRVTAGGEHPGEDQPITPESIAWDVGDAPFPVDSFVPFRVMYAVPSDREFREELAQGIRDSVASVQSWYLTHTGDVTFAVEGDVVVCRMEEKTEYYEWGAWPKVREGVQHCAAVGGVRSDSAWIVFADVPSRCGDMARLNRGGPGLTMMDRDVLHGLAGERLRWYGRCGGGPYDGEIGKWRGTIGHEVGHAMGLPHPPGCDEGLDTCDKPALMSHGGQTYPNTYLRTDDKAFLRANSLYAGPPTDPENVSRGFALSPWLLTALEKVRESVE